MGRNASRSCYYMFKAKASLKYAADGEQAIKQHP
jgi:hypothetical protein